MKESAAVRFLYRTVPGRTVLKLLTGRRVSEAAGRFLSSGLSRGLVPYYIRKYKIDMSDIRIPEGGFSSFNEFFIRKRRNDDCPGVQDGVISPCDGFLSVVPVERNTVFAVKHTGFSLEELLKDPKLAGRFQDGTALIFRLTPANYHRYCYVADGQVLRHRRLSGKLHCVRPVALEAFPVFAQNTREYQVIRTDRLGWMIQMEIGAMLVGRIRNHRRFSGAGRVSAGEEKGYFEFGGSTILLLFQKDAVRVREELYARKNADGEIPVRKGEWVAEKPRKGEDRNDSQ